MISCMLSSAGGPAVSGEFQGASKQVRAMDPGVLDTERALLRAILAQSKSQHGACTYFKKLQQVQAPL